MIGPTAGETLEGGFRRERRPDSSGSSAIGQAREPDRVRLANEDGRTMISNRFKAMLAGACSLAAVAVLAAAPAPAGAFVYTDNQSGGVVQFSGGSSGLLSPADADVHRGRPVVHDDDERER